MSSTEMTLSEFQSRAQKARHAKRSKEERSAYARRISKARWDRMTPEQRRAATAHLRRGKKKTRQSAARKSHK